MAVTTTSRALILRLLARLVLDRPGDAHGVLLGFSANLLNEDLLGLVLRHLADPLERLDLLLARTAQLFLGLIDLALARDQLPVALLEHVAALVELLIALQQAAFEAAHLLALGARLVFGLARQADLLVLGLEDQLLLLRACLGQDPARLVLRSADRLRCPE